MFSFLDINECADPNKSPCNGTCTNLPGSFMCSCLHGYDRHGRDCVANDTRSRVLKSSLGKEINALLMDIFITISC